MFFRVRKKASAVDHADLLAKISFHICFIHVKRYGFPETILVRDITVEEIEHFRPEGENLFNQSPVPFSSEDHLDDRLPLSDEPAYLFERFTVID